MNAGVARGYGWPRVLLALVVGATLFAATALQMLSNLAEENRPALSTMLWPGNDRAYAFRASVALARSDAAREMMETGKISGTVTGDLEQVRAHARQALQASPLQPAALRNLAYVALIGGDEARALELARAGTRLSRRDAASQLLLTRAAILDRDLPRALGHFDTALRTNSSAQREMFPLLASALISDELRRDFAPYLRSDNPWLADFLVFALTSAPDQRLIGRLVLDAPELPERPGNSLRELAVPQMVQIGEPVLARGIAAAMPADRRPAPGGSVSNAQFSLSSDVVPPFGWVTAEDGTVNYTGESPLRIDSEYSYRGVLLRQLVTLSPGRYRLVFDGTLSPGVSWTVSCLGTSAVLTSGATGGGAEFTVPAGGCPGQWVVLAAEGRQRVEAELERLAIEAVRQPE